MAKKEKRVKTGEKKKEKEWRDYTAEAYYEAAKEMVHFSFKTVNSNISGGGVRLAQTDVLNLPYVSARTLIGKGFQIEADYTGDASTANIFSQIRSLLEGEQPASIADYSVIKNACISALGSRLESNCGNVSPRMRQLLIPKDGTYIAISPVGASGLNAIINGRVREHNDSRDKSQQSWVGQAQIGIGGSKYWNVGLLAREMQNPLYFEGPTESKRIKAALSIHYKGVPLTVPKNLALEYRAWREEKKAKNEGRIPTDMRTREHEEAFAGRMASAVLLRGARAYMVLRDHMDVLPTGGNPMVSEKVDPVVRGIIDPTLREKGWEHRFSLRMADQLAAYEFHDEQGGLGLDDGAVARIASWIEGGLR